MTRVCIDGHPLTATAALVWNGDLPRPLQQILFDTADGVTGRWHPHHVRQPDQGSNTPPN
jgi:hypothetical protein